MRTFLSRLAAWLALGLLCLGFTDAQAVPSFARQTGMDCTTCHMSWLELTTIGRRFKLGGYQLMKSMPDDAERPLLTFRFDENAPLIPLAAMIQASITSTANTRTAGTDAATDFPHDRGLLFQQGSLFLNGKLADHVGCFCQITYDGAADHVSVDNIEVRIADEFKGESVQALYGLSINNSPTMSDIYNTTPVWGWPYAGPTVAPAPAAGTLINGGIAQTSVGFTAYTLLNRTLYLEAGGYRNADHFFRLLSAGVPKADVVEISGTSPYYRVALQQDFDKGRQSAMIGSFGLSAKKFIDAGSLSGPTDHFRDVGFDAQYQYITDEHRFSAMFTHINERQELNASQAAGGATNLKNTVSQNNAKVSYYYDKWYGVSAGLQTTKGTADALIYNTGAPVGGSVSGSPNSTARILELNYLFSLTGAQTHRRDRIVLQYTSYSKFNGGTTNYDGFGRNAKDNNTLYLLGWFLF